MNRPRPGGTGLRRAYRNLAYTADGTWTAEPTAYQRASLELRLREERLASKTSLRRLLPRTVRDAIPGSRLARYGDYHYAKNREMCYAAATAVAATAGAATAADERRQPWATREVDELFARLAGHRDEGEEARDAEMQRGRYDVFRSPFFEATTADEIVLKLKTVGVKRYWETDKSFHPRNPLVTKEKVLFLYKSSTGNISVSEENPLEKDRDGEHYFKDFPEIDRYFSHLKELSESFKEQSFWVSAGRHRRPHLERGWLDAGAAAAADYADADAPHRRLYSAVLQGARAAKPPPARAAASDGRMVLLAKNRDYEALLRAQGGAAATAVAPNGAALLAQLAVRHAQAAAYRALANGGAGHAQWAWPPPPPAEEEEPRHAHRPVGPSRSEELELQALRQYSASETELEREAAEQYEGPSENWRRPPNRDQFGGWARAWACRPEAPLSCC